MLAESREKSGSTEGEVIRRAIAGDHDALEQIFTKHSPALYQTALRLVGSPEEAEDVLQEGMLNAFRNLRRFEGRSQFSTWLTRIVINAGLMRLRSRRARPAVSLDERLSGEDEATFAEQLPDASPNPEQVYAREELRGILHRHLARLSPVLRSAFLLREVQGLSTQEAAQSLGVSEGTLKARLHRAKRQLEGLFGRAVGAARNGHKRWPAFRPAASSCASD